MVETGRQLEIPVKVSETAARTMLVPFSTPFTTEVINTPMLRKVKMPALELYDGTTDSKAHLVVHKAQMYVQDVDDVAYCQYFPTTLKGVAQSWFNDLPLGSISCFQELVN